MQKNNDLMIHAKVLTDGFPSFARKLEVATRDVKGTQNRLTHCKQHGVTFNGTSVHRNLFVAVTNYTDRIWGDTHALLMRLEHKFGKGVLTGKYNNLNRIIQICFQEIGAGAKMWDDASTSDLVAHVIHFIT